MVVVRPIRNEFKESRKKYMKEALFKMAAPFGEVVNFAISYYRHEVCVCVCLSYNFNSQT